MYLNGCDVMGVKWTTKITRFPEVEASINDLQGKTVHVGVLGGGENAWLASIHEYGCIIYVTPRMRAYLAKTGLHLKSTTKQIVIPERAFLRNGFDENKTGVINDTKSLLADVMGGTLSANQFLDTVGLLLKGCIQDYATELNNPPNHPYTVEKKGSSNPLVDTGDMIGSITYKVE